MKATNALTKKILLVLFLMTFLVGLGQNIQLSNQAKISVLTCGTGNESYSLFGHTAIRVQDSLQALDLVYNYGAFDFRTPNFVAKFAKGDLNYFVVASSYIDFIGSYSAEERAVYEQNLVITAQQKQLIFDNLNRTLLSDERYYTYKFIDKNCTSMVVDLINTSLGGTVISKKGDTSETYRSVLFPYFEGHFYESLGTSIIFGTKVDEKATRIFLPFELKNSLAKTTFQDHLLAPKTTTVLAFDKKSNHSWWNNWYTYIVFLVVLLVVNKRAVDFTYLTVLGFLGIFFISMGFYSFHQELAWNYNILLFSPLYLIMLVFAITRNKKAVYKLAIVHSVLLIIYGLYCANKAHFLIVLPLVATTLLILLRIALRNKKTIPIIL